MDSKSNCLERVMLETDKCDWCRDKKATITDKTYVYCSNKCKKLFLENVFEAIKDAYESINKF